MASHHPQSPPLSGSKQDAATQRNDDSIHHHDIPADAFDGTKLKDKWVHAALIQPRLSASETM